MKRWIGKTAVVTGAGGGIGAAIAEALGNAGLRVVGLERQPHITTNGHTKSCNQSGLIIRHCDISCPEQVAAAFHWVEENYGGVHVVVNNAGVLHEGQITSVGSETISDDQVLASINTNIGGTMFCTRHAVASMMKHDFDGHVVNITSLAAHYIPFTPMLNVYASTKHAVRAFTSSLANEFAHFNSRIKTTAISPGYTRTHMARAEEDHLPMLQPSHVANAVLYALATPPDVNVTELTIQPVMEKRL